MISDQESLYAVSILETNEMIESLYNETSNPQLRKSKLGLGSWEENLQRGKKEREVGRREGKSDDEFR